MANRKKIYQNGPRVALATTWMFPHVGGVSTHMTLLANALGIEEADVLSFAQIIAQPENFWHRGHRFFASRLRQETVTSHAERMVHLLRSVDCDVLHCHDAMATWAAGVSRERYRKKFRIVSTVHGPVSRHMVEHGSSPSSPEVRGVEARESLAWQFADQIIAVDSTQKAICIEQKADPEKISVIPNAVDLNEIDNKCNLLRLKKHESEDWLLVPRRLAPKNGVIHAIEAMRMLPARVKLWIAGDGIEESRYRQALVDLKLENRVALLGGLPRDVVLMLSSAAKATIIPSVPAYGIVEATSIAAIEAMACRVPVVASSIGGLAELIEHRTTGLLVPPAQPEAIAAEIKMLLSGNFDVDGLTDAARSRVEALYSLPVWMKKITQVYERALSIQPKN